MQWLFDQINRKMVLCQPYYSMYGQQKQLPRNVSGVVVSTNKGRSLLLNQMIEMWISNAVDDQYQSIVSHYIDGLEDWKIQAKEIEKEIQMTVARKSYYFVLAKLIEERRTAMVQLKSEIIGLNRYIQNDSNEEPDLYQVSVLLGRIRRMQIVMCEVIVQMDEKYNLLKLSRSKIQKRGVCYIELLTRFDSDLKYLKQSLLRYYVPFTLQFDPFFVEHGKDLKKLIRQNIMIYDNNIEKLFSLSPSFMHRLIRGKKKMLSLITRNLSYNQADEGYSQDKSNDKKTHNTKSYDRILQDRVYDPMLINNSLQSDITIKKKRSISQLINNNKLKNSAYLQEKDPSENEFMIEKLNPIVAYPSRKQKQSINDQKQYRLKISLKNQRQTQEDQSLYDFRIRSRTRSKRQITPEQIEKNTITSKKKQINENKLKIYPSVFKVDVKNQVLKQNFKKYRKKSIKQIQNQTKYGEFQNQRSYDRVKDATDKISDFKFKILREMKTPSVKKHQQNGYFQQKQEEQTQYLQKQDKKSALRSYFKKQSFGKQQKSQSPKIQYSKMINPFPQHPYKSSEIITPKKHSKGDSLLLQVNKRNVKEENEIAPQKSKQKRIVDSLEQKQKQIIRNINQKYKAMAQKQKQYELSKLGHNIVHKMKQKQRMKHNQNKTISNKVFVQKQ